MTSVTEDASRIQSRDKRHYYALKSLKYVQKENVSNDSKVELEKPERYYCICSVQNFFGFSHAHRKHQINCRLF